MKKLSSFKFDLTAILLTLLTLMSLVSCATATAPTSTPSTSTTQTQLQPKFGGTLHLRIQIPPYQMDPALQAQQQAQAITQLYNSTLVKYQGRDFENTKIVPNLASSWEVSPDGLVYTFHLREGVKFQNIAPVNGRECTAQDFKYTFDRILDPATKAAVKGYFISVDKVEAIGKYTLKITLKASDPIFILNLAQAFAAPLAKEVFDKDGNFGKTFIGTGPFIVEKYSETTIVLSKNPDYWEKGKPYLDKVEVTVIPEETSCVAAMRAGQLDGYQTGIESTNLIKKTNQEVTAIPGAVIDGTALKFGMNFNPKLWGDVRVRKAVMYALDPQAILNACAQGQGTRVGWLAPKFKEWGAPTVESLWKRDVAKSKALLAEAGYPTGFKTSIIQHVARMDAWGCAVEPIAAMLKDVGIQAEIKPLDSATFPATHRAGQFELAAVAFLTTYMDPSWPLVNCYYSKGTYPTSYTLPELDNLILQQNGLSNNPEERKKVITKIYNYLDENVPVLPLYQQYKFQVNQPWVKGWDNVGDGNMNYAFQEVVNVWLNK